MNIYIGYKYRNFDDKESLKKLLLHISDTLHLMGHKTFILGRDELNWYHQGSPSKSVFPIIINMKKNDVFFAVVECSKKSTGLLFESLFSKIFGKKMILAKKADVDGKPFTLFTKNIIEFQTYEDLINKIKEELPKYL